MKKRFNTENKKWKEHNVGNNTSVIKCLKDNKKNQAFNFNYSHILREINICFLQIEKRTKND